MALYNGDALTVLSTLPSASVDALVTDPPAGIGFMGKQWDQPGAFVERQANTAVKWDQQNGNHHPVNQADRLRTQRSEGARFRAGLTEIFIECRRVLKPGAHALVWALPRTSHWTATALEDAGFEIRDVVVHLFGSGFPKSLDVGKAIDRAADYRLRAEVRRAAVVAVEQAGLTLPSNSRWDWTTGEHAPGDKWWQAFQTWIPGLTDEQRETIERQILGTVQKMAGWFTSRDIYDLTAPATEGAAQWDGWGTALKPAAEMWLLCRKPCIDVPTDAIIEAATEELVKLLCQLSPASLAEHCSRSSQSASVGASASVRWLAAALNTLSSNELSGQMATFSSPAAGSTFLSIATLWSSVLDAISSRASMFTTETVSALTTETKTLSSWTSSLTATSTNLSAILTAGSLSNADIAGALLSAVVVKLSDILTLIAPETATELAAYKALLASELLRDDNEIISGGLPDLAPASEHWILCRAPLAEPNIAANVLAHGVGGINVQACRVAAPDGVPNFLHKAQAHTNTYGDGLHGSARTGALDTTTGRWPANVTLDEEAADLLDQQSGTLVSGANPTRRGSPKFRNAYGDFLGQESCDAVRGIDTGGASRFYYVAKPSQNERNAGLNELPAVIARSTVERHKGNPSAKNGARADRPRQNDHPTVKSIALMRWLCRLITPLGGTVLDCFMGSGTTGCAAALEGLQFIGIEKDAHYFDLAQRRIVHWSSRPQQAEMFA